MGRSISTGTAGSGGSGLGGLSVISSTITSTQTDADIILDPNGAGKVRIPDTTTSTSGTTGALVVTGGVGIGENLNVTGTGAIGQTLTVTGGIISSAIGSTGPNTGAFTTLSASGITQITNNTVSSTVSNGALVVTGGVGIGGALNVQGAITSGGASLLTGNTRPALGTNAIIRTNANTISEDITIPAGTNGMSAGPITIASGRTVTVNGDWSVI